MRTASVATALAAGLSALVAPSVAAGTAAVTEGARTYICRPIGTLSALYVNEATADPPPLPPQELEPGIAAPRLVTTGGPTLCPAGELAVQNQQPQPLLKKHAPGTGRAGQKRNAATSEPHYFHVTKAWAKTTEGLGFSVMTTRPFVSEFPGAHSIAQLWLGKGSNSQGTPHWDIELGWIRESSNATLEKGYKSPRIFYFVNPDYYGSESCYSPCHWVPNAEAKHDVIGEHLYPTDGSPESKCGWPGEEQVSPCTARVSFFVHQYKGAWWIAADGEWEGRISDEAWGNHFTKGNVDQVYGEVYDGAPPTTYMGNGNAGTCTCSIEMATPSYFKVKKTRKGGTEEVSETWERLTLSGSSSSEDDSPYSSGLPNSDQTTFHFGGQ